MSAAWRWGAIAGLGLLGAAVMTPRTSAAFHSDSQFVEDAAEGGADGIFYTGSPRSRGYDCSACHLDAPVEARLVLATDPGELLSALEYVPGEIYEFTVKLEGETRGMGSATNFNTFALELLDAEDEPVGGFFGFDGESLRTQDDGGVLFAQGRDDATSWTFLWQAPEAGTGYLDAYIAVVDGDGAGEVEGQGATDPFNDDVLASVFRIAEQGTPAPELSLEEPEEDRDVTACRVGRRGSSSALLIVLLMLAWRVRGRARLGRGF